MLIKDVERYTIPIASGEFREGEGTTVEELIKALKKLPSKGVIGFDWGQGNILVTHHKPDIDPDLTVWTISDLQEIIGGRVRPQDQYSIKVSDS